SPGPRENPETVTPDRPLLVVTPLECPEGLDQLRDRGCPTGRGPADLTLASADGPARRTALESRSSRSMDLPAGTVWDRVQSRRETERPSVPRPNACPRPCWKRTLDPGRSPAAAARSAMSTTWATGSCWSPPIASAHSIGSC